MPAVKADPDDSDRLALLDAPCDQGRVGKRAESHCVANQKGEQKENAFISRRRSDASTRLTHSEMRLNDTVKQEFQTRDSDTEEEPCSTFGHQKPRDSCSEAHHKPLTTAPCEGSPKRVGLSRLLGQPAHVCRSCMETHSQLRPFTRCERSFSCELCPEVFTNSGDLAEHFRTHVNSPLFICERCSITFSSKTHFDRHLGEHGLGQPRNCHPCPEKFDDEVKLRVHTDVHIRENSRCGSGQGPVVGRARSSNCFDLQDDPGVGHDEPFTAHRTCHFCAQKIDDQKEHGEHVRTEQPAGLPMSSSEDKKPPISESIFESVAASTEAGELVHEPSSSMDRSFPESSEVKPSFGARVRTRSHCDAEVLKAEPWPQSSTMETAPSAEEQLPHACHVCPEELDDDDDLLRHTRTESGSNRKRSSGHDGRAEKRFACEHCSKRFRIKGHLNRHLVTHTGETRFHCHLCPAKFTQNGDLKRHVHRHVGYKRFQCPLCPKQFIVKDEMESHRRTHTGERPFSCNLCPAAFSARDNLKKHVSSHKGVRPYACQQCPRSFTRLADLKRHGRRHTGERPYSCDSCSRTFTRGHMLRDHVVAAHPTSVNRPGTPD